VWAEAWIRLGGFLDDCDIGFHRCELALHTGDVGAGGGSGGGELSGGEDRPEQDEDGGEGGGRLDPGTDPDPPQGLAVMEENVARLEHRAEHSVQSRIVCLSQHINSPTGRPELGAVTQERGRKH
jgi:hypothetical protein